MKRINQSRPANPRPPRPYDRDWAEFARNYLCENPACARCPRAAQVVDHVVPLSKGGAKFAAANLQPLCARCHNRKTATEDGGFGCAPG